MSQKLTAKQKIFVKEYMIDLNATQAAIRAGYSKKSATMIAFETLTKPYIQEYLTKSLEERNKRLDIDADYVLKRLVDFDMLDVLDILDEQGNIKSIAEWPKVWRTSIAGIDVSTIGGGGDNIAEIVKKIKWPDKVKNLEMIGKHIDVQAWNEKREIDLKFGELNDDELIEAARKLGKELGIS